MHPPDEDIISFKVESLPPAGPDLPLSLRSKVSVGEASSVTVRLDDFRRIRLVLIGEVVRIHGACDYCQNFILGSITLHIDTVSVFDLLCPFCTRAFCRVGDQADPSPRNLTISCICDDSSISDDLIPCIQCSTWQHLKCYYDENAQPKKHTCGTCLEAGYHSLDIAGTVSECQT